MLIFSLYSGSTFLVDSIKVNLYNEKSFFLKVSKKIDYSSRVTCIISHCQLM